MAGFGIKYRMCEGCGQEFQRFFHKVCLECSGDFCHNCFVKDIQSCRPCKSIRSHSVQRIELESMTMPRLKNVVSKRRVPLQTTSTPVIKSTLVEAILVNQAKVLSERALTAQRQLVNPSVLGELNFMSKRDVQVSPPSVDPGANPGHTGLNFDPSSVGNLSDLSSEDQIRMLGVRQLKIILQRNCIDYRGCVEKTELMDRVKRLWLARKKEKEMEKRINDTGDEVAEQDFLCKICMDSPIDCVLLECGHMLTCVRCGRQLSECPICRQYVSRVVHAFKV